MDGYLLLDDPPEKAPHTATVLVGVTMESVKVEILDELIRDSADSVKVSLSTIVDQLNSEGEKYGSYRSSAIAFAGSVISLLLAVATLGIVGQNQQVTLLFSSLIVAVIAALVALLFTLENIARNRKRVEFEREFSPIVFALDYAKTAFHSMIVVDLGGKTETVTREFYDFFVVLKPAIMHRVLGVARDHLDKETTDLFQHQTRFACEHIVWDALGTKTATMLIEGSHFIKRIVDEYRAYCESS